MTTPPAIFAQFGQTLAFAERTLTAVLREHLAERGTKPETELDRFDLQRRLVTKEHVERQSIQNKHNLEADDNAFRDLLRQTAADPALTREYLVKVSMIGSLRRAEQLG